jgi:hypothetical protein
MNRETPITLIDPGQRYRLKLPISTSRAEGCIDEIANARFGNQCRERAGSVRIIKRYAHPVPHA